MGYVVPPLIAWRPHPPVWDSSASLPGSAGYSDGLWHSRAILPAPQTFRTFTAVLSRIAAFSLRREPQYVRLSSSASALAIG